MMPGDAQSRMAVMAAAANFCDAVFDDTAAAAVFVAVFTCSAVVPPAHAWTNSLFCLRVLAHSSACCHLLLLVPAAAASVAGYCLQGSKAAAQHCSSVAAVAVAHLPQDKSHNLQESRQGTAAGAGPKRQCMLADAVATGLPLASKTGVQAGSCEA